MWVPLRSARSVDAWLLRLGWCMGCFVSLGLDGQGGDARGAHAAFNRLTQPLPTR